MALSEMGETPPSLPHDAIPPSLSLLLLCPSLAGNMYIPTFVPLLASAWQAILPSTNRPQTDFPGHQLLSELPSSPTPPILSSISTRP